MDLSFELPTAWPYVGAKYQVVTRFQLRILILGESHYHDRPLTREFTGEVVRAAIKGDDHPSLRFFAKTVGVFYGGPQNLTVRQDFWQSVAFYNFVQEPAGSTPRTRPSSKMWANAVPAFREVLDKLQPEFVLVLGRELWRHLSVLYQFDRTVRLPSAQTDEGHLLLLASGCRAFFFPINHPSSVGWSYRKWSPLVQIALEEAKRQRVGGA